MCSAWAASGADKALISNVRVFDLYEGDALGAGKKSLGLEVTLSPTEKTLTDAEIDAVSKKVFAEVKKEFEATQGENVMRDVYLAEASLPGEYRVDLFIHVQYVTAEGQGRILNNSEMGLELRK